MPELTFKHLPDILEKNKIIYHEVDSCIKSYLKDYHIKGWDIIDGAKRWIADEHYLIQAPIDDPSLGGFISFATPKHICYLNTWQPRVYQNFVLLHEIFHMICQTQQHHSKVHVIESDLDLSAEERKADYFASLLLLDAGEVINFYNSLEEDPFIYKVFLTMDRFLTPYKSVLIRLFELELIEVEELREWFDVKLDLEAEFIKSGLDPAPVQRSLVINFQAIEGLLEQQKERLPDIANEGNWKTFHTVKMYFESRQNPKGFGNSHANHKS